MPLTSLLLKSIHMMSFWLRSGLRDSTIRDKTAVISDSNDVLCFWTRLHI